MKPSRASAPKTKDAASVTSRMPLSTTWVWHVNAGGVKGVLTKFLIWSSEREAVKGFSEIVAVRQLNKSGYVLALKLIFGTLNLRIFESLTADNSGNLVNAASFHLSSLAFKARHQ